ncbi:MAG: alanine:cation symporter family protein [Clostridia bacterium]|nr:alanine:cation symporter family protein [Clostridia bacterium]
MMSKILSLVNDFMYSYLLIIILIVGGLYFTLRSGLVQFRLFGEQIRVVGEKPSRSEESGKKKVSSFQALMVSTASRVGTGNIIGVSTALCLGGFGSVFWMWVIAIIGAATAFAESTLAQIYKKKAPDGTSYGGPAQYIEGGLRLRSLAVIFSVLLVVTYGFGFNMLASYNLQSTFSTYEFYDPSWTPWLIGGIIALAVGYCLFGGGSRVLRVTGVLVPIMGVAYVLVSLVIVAMNITSLPSVFGRIFSEAFDFKAIFGGFGGSCVMYGIKRGLFSNEAGVGSAPNAAAAAEVSHPVKQGLVQALSVFIDTVVICSATAFMCLCSGIEPAADLQGAPYVQKALGNTLGDFGPAFITVSMILFAFTTLLGNLYYVNQAFSHIMKRVPTKKFMYCYYVVASLIIFVGAGLSADMLWSIADITMGMMAIINMPVIVILSGQVFRTLKNYVKQKKAGKNPEFKAADISLPHETDFWN